MFNSKEIKAIKEDIAGLIAVIGSHKHCEYSSNLHHHIEVSAMRQEIINLRGELDEMERKHDIAWDRLERHLGIRWEEKTTRFAGYVKRGLKK